MSSPKVSHQRRSTQHVKGYEERAYPAAKWVCHSQVQQAASRRKDTRSFFALFRYIDGGNEAEAKIPMTAPVRMKKTPTWTQESRRPDVLLPARSAHHGQPTAAPTNAELYIEGANRLHRLRQDLRRLREQGARLGRKAAEALKVSLEAAQEEGVDFSLLLQGLATTPR
ncbi:uncharacterized protein [Penaeus vannamei]|uniref:uncharacterized protein n=1 Tax=Penaeus vannamei TaxID=6689 RepID=UPI00387FAA01